MIASLHHALQPAGPQAAALAQLWWVTLAVCTVVFSAVIAILALAVWRAPRADATTAPDLSRLDRPEPALRRWVGFGVATSTVLLLGLLVATVLADRALARLALGDAVNIELTAHQFWWEARYDDPLPSRVFVTANELHVPVGRPVLLKLRASDVIHSFWVPSLNGKKDLIPGRISTLSLRADRAGVYRGQCAEFCGYQHANMALFVIADEPAAYASWAATQRRPAAMPEDGEARRGFELFTRSSCAMCHAIAGTQAQGRHAPDLTHLASRATLAAGVLPNNAATRAAWITDPQKIKPGVNMPPHAFAPADLAALNAFLGTLE